MSVVNFTGRGAYIPDPMGWLNGDFPSAFAAGGSMATATRKVAMIGHMINPSRSAKYIKSVSFRMATIAKAGSTDVQVSIQGIKADEPGGDGTISGATNNCKVNIGNANLVSNTWINVADFNEQSSLINYGQGISIVFQFSTFNAGDGFAVSAAVGSYVTGALGSRRAYHTNYNGAAWTADSAYAVNVVLNFTDGTVGTLDGSFVVDSEGSITYNNTSATKEVAIEFTPPFAMVIDGMWMTFTPNSYFRNYSIRLWENDTVLETLSFVALSDLDPLSNKRLIASFANTYTLDPTKTYRISHRADTGGDQTLYYYGVNANAHFDCAQWGKDMYYNTHDGSSWGTPTTTRRLWGGVRICGISSSSGGSSGGEGKSKYMRG